MILILAALGLVMGSFISALTWRVFKLESKSVKNKAKYSMSRGRSMCPRCQHQLKAADLVPIFSWLTQHGRCRYCQKPISWQYPAVELATALAFVGSFVWWPDKIVDFEIVLFGFWLIFMVGLVALTVYDLRHMILPDVIVYPLIALAMVQVVAESLLKTNDAGPVRDAVLGLFVLGGLFYGLFIASKGRWIGGGDVKLGFFLGIVLGPALSLLTIFLASLVGSVISLILLASKRINLKQPIPFGPYLILAACFAVLFGQRIVDWYNDRFLDGLL